jgi:hypothetical protein
LIRIDYPQAALLGAALITILALLSQWRILRRMRQAMQRDLARIFEQVDLLRLDSQQSMDLEAAPAPAFAAAPPADAGLSYAAALELASRGADENEITARCGLSGAEARILVAMRGMQGRARGSRADTPSQSMHGDQCTV